MVWRRNYSPLATEDSDTARASPMSLQSWGALALNRRVRTAIVATFFLVPFGIIFVHFLGLQDRVRGLAYETTGVTPAAGNCSAIQDNGKSAVNYSSEVGSESSVRWSDFAYVQYVTSK